MAGSGSFGLRIGLSGDPVTAAASLAVVAAGIVLLPLKASPTMPPRITIGEKSGRFFGVGAGGSIAASFS